MFEQSLIIAFHQTSRRFYPGINNIKPGYFFDIINLCKEWGFTFQKPETFGREAGTSNNIIITFDDGYTDNFDILLQLCEQEIFPFLFIPTEYIGHKNSWEYSSALFPTRHLDENQLRQLSDQGVVIGSHGLSHRSFTTMSRQRVCMELTDSKKRLEDITGAQIDSISFPFGRSNLTVNELVKDCGYRFAFGLGGRGGSDDNFVVDRTAIYSIDDYYSLRGKIISGSKMEKNKDRTINDLAAGTIIVAGRLN